MDFNIIKEVNKVIKRKGFKKLSREEQTYRVFESIRFLVDKFLISFQISVNEDERLSNMVIELNRYLEFGVRQKFNQELSHALVNALIAIEGHNVELIETNNRSLRINPLYCYDINMTLQSIKTYSEMDLGNLSVSLLKTIEANLFNNKSLKLQVR